MDKNIILAAHQVFETERLILRKIELEDTAAMFEYASDPETVRYVTFPVHENIERTKEGIANFFMLNRLNAWGIVEKSSGKFIGGIDLRVTGDKGEFGWILNKKYWGKGYMPEAASRLRDFAFDELGLNVLTADHYAENPKSGRVMEKVGMKHMGQIYIYVAKEEGSVLADYWALTRADYEKKAH